MNGYIFVAVLNGVLIGVSRALNGKLGIAIGPLRASFWNHLVGFVFLAAVLIVVGGWSLENLSAAPALAWFGGMFGALFVATNSLVLPRLGAIRTAVLVICGQMVAGLAIDYLANHTAPEPLQLAGIVVIMLGVLAARLSGARKASGG
ncbi:transporter family-2 protein [Aminobacter aminovorans]|jgi:transporter family-2 protein|uniref:Uncharacterized protein conserved in bacteria n=1 Tax=Aminobacter aminovorans TaxID=83263 RepID=A0A380WFU2_AMIAI|nr:DMT family transporter [Aminobacter aminovorans]TCS21648.1 transporter family-2 protein [Aminobacter aminovorans]SUU87608.1 Uncharacterized protein conserved in bacteria [Aminobacter aminovorans]